MTDSDNSKAKIVTLSDRDLRAVINSTVVDGKYWLERCWAIAEVARRAARATAEQSA